MNDTSKIIANLNDKDKPTLQEILTAFDTGTIDELFKKLSKNFSEMVSMEVIDEEIFSSFYLFIVSKLVSSINGKKEALELKSFYKELKDMLHAEIKPYNKGLKEKDGRYHLLSSINTNYKHIEAYIDELLEVKRTNHYFKVLWFVIKDLNNVDYLFRLFELHPDFVNLRSEKNVHLFCYLCNYYMHNLGNMTDREINFYKRVIVMMLESDKLSLTTDELFSLLKRIENKKRNVDANDAIHLSFVSNEIDRHYEAIKKDGRLTCIDYCFRECPLTFMRRSNKTRVDLKSDFIFSIDSAKGNETQNRLFDDAFSFKDNGNGSFTLFMHIPDVDYYIKKDSLTDFYMRSIGESVYARGYQRPMLSYEASKVCSLKQGELKPAITFAITVDRNGKILDVDFYKSVIRVNYNLSNNSADLFMKKHPDERFKVLNSMYNLLAIICKNRKASVGSRSPSTVIMDEMNIIADLATAKYFEQNGIVFPYKNFKGNKVEKIDLLRVKEFIDTHSLSEDDIALLNSIIDGHNRVFYDTVNYGNTEFNGEAIGNVGNPLRQYISLETDRLIKDVVISGEKNIDYWLERIERDCIEYTETSAKIKQLYGKR